MSSTRRTSAPAARSAESRSVELATRRAYLLPHFRIDGERLTFLGRPFSELDLREEEHGILSGERTLGHYAGSPRFELLLAQVVRLHRRGAVLLWRDEARNGAAAEPDTLVLSPHSDDVALSIAGLLLNERGNSVPHVLNVCTDSQWTIFADAYRTRAEVTAIRVQEDELMARLLGARIEFLHLHESYHQESVAANLAVQRAADEDGGRPERIYREIERRLRSGSYSRAFFPLGVGYHADHLSVHDSALRLLRAGLLEGVRVAFYEDLPYAYLRASDLTERVESLRAAGVVLRRRAVAIDDVLAERMQLCGLYRSQHGRELLRRVHLYLRRHSLGAGPQPCEPESARSRYHECHWEVVG